MGKFPLRYVVHGLIDGIVTGFGAALGASITGDVNITIITIIAASVSCAVADITSIYSSAEADLMQEFVDLENIVGVRSEVLKKSKTYHTRRKKILNKSLIDGVTCLFGGLILLIPFILFKQGILETMEQATLFLLPMTVILLGILGGFIAKLSKESLTILSIKTALIGFVAFLIIFILTRFGFVHP